MSQCKGVATANSHRYLKLAGLWLLMLLPAALLTLANINLFPLIALDSPLASLFYAITFSGTAPWGAVTAAALVAYGFFSLSRTEATGLLLATSLSLLAGLLLNETLKSHFAAPRPNVVLLANAGLIEPTTFYQQNTLARQSMMISQTQAPRAELPALSVSIKQHWQQEVGYSFPSGHTLFSAVLSLTACWYFLASGHWGVAILLTGWTLAMGFSRMLLGMHYSEDVLAATLIALPLSALGIGLSSWLSAGLTKRAYT